MSDPRAHFVASKYGDDISAPGPDDLIGAGMGDFMPWLKVAGGAVSGILGGGGGESGGGNAQMMQMMMMQQQQQAAAQAAAQAQAAREAAARNQMLMFAGLGVVALGGILFFVLKK